MPSVGYSQLNQDAVAWPFVRRDSHGEPVVSDAVELFASYNAGVRWVNKRRELHDANGNVIAIDATVTTDRYIPIGSIMWEGNLDTDLSGTAGVPTSDLFQVVVSNKTPDLKARDSLYEVMLMRFGGPLPEIE